MKRKSLLILLILSLMVSLVACSSGGPDKDNDVDAVIENDVEKEDDIQENEVEGMEDKRIIAGTLMSAELLDLFDVNPVGVLTSEKGLPARYDNTAKIGSPMKPDLEIVTSLEPEVYITDASQEEALEELFKGSDFEMLYLSNNSYENIFTNIENVGQYLGKEDKANEIISEMRAKEKRIMDSVAGKESPNVLVLFGTPESFMIATPNSYTGNLVEKLGGTNVASDLAQGKPMPYLPFSLETIADMNPDIILRLTHVSPELSRKAFEEEFSKGFWTNLDAVKNDNVFDLDPDHFGVTANMRVMSALENMAEILYN
ncbi:MAG: ABC transporter substrate-binding protein [Tissierella sp.]|nr:ABC transporter substrate-binding protein [Tissierella sp.]